MTAQARTAGTVNEQRINTFVARVYLLMAVGFVVTALTSVWFASSMTRMIKFVSNPWLAWGLFFVQIMLVVALSASVMRLKPIVAALIFLLYAALTGVTLSSIFLVYSNEQIASVFWICAGTFFIASVVGLVSKRDMSKGGGAIAMLLLGWLIAWMFSLFFPDSNFNWFLNFVGILLFVGLTVRDSNRIKALGQQVESQPARGGLMVIGALQLYLDFINLFLLMLRASSR